MRTELIPASVLAAVDHVDNPVVSLVLPMSLSRHEMVAALWAWAGPEDDLWLMSPAEVWACVAQAVVCLGVLDILKQFSREVYRCDRHRLEACEREFLAACEWQADRVLAIDPAPAAPADARLLALVAA